MLHDDKHEPHRCTPPRPYVVAFGPSMVLGGQVPHKLLVSSLACAPGLEATNTRLCYYLPRHLRYDEGIIIRTSPLLTRRRIKLCNKLVSIEKKMTTWRQRIWNRRQQEWRGDVEAMSMSGREWAADSNVRNAKGCLKFQVPRSRTLAEQSDKLPAYFSSCPLAKKIIPTSFPVETARGVASCTRSIITITSMPRGSLPSRFIPLHTHTISLSSCLGQEGSCRYLSFHAIPTTLPIGAQAFATSDGGVAHSQTLACCTCPMAHQK